MVSYAAVKTNGHLRPLVNWHDLPADQQAWFDYVKEDDERWNERFVKYGGSWYDVNDSQRITVAPNHTPFGFNVRDDHPLAGWDGIATESHWSGVVFRWPTDEEVFRYDLYMDRYGYIVCGRYIA